MVRTKVFVGNLSFNTKENELAKEFEVAGKVVSANIITRGPRSLGYGFVEMDSEVDAENAVKLLNKKEIDGRPINVEVAKPREDNEQRSGGNNSRGSPRGRGSRGGFRGGFRGGNRRFRRRETGSDDEEREREREHQPERRGRGGFRGRGGPRQRGSPRFRRERDESRPDTRAPSQTTLFVANLPFSLDDDGFGKVLKDSNLSFKTAHVVKKKSGRSKGFGFVEFENSGDQQKALAAIHNKEVDGRPLVAKVALTENKTPDSPLSEKKEEEKKESSTSSSNSNSNTTSSTPKPVTPKNDKK